MAEAQVLTLDLITAEFGAGSIPIFQQKTSHFNEYAPTLRYISSDKISLEYLCINR